MQPFINYVAFGVWLAMLAFIVFVSYFAGCVLDRQGLVPDTLLKSVLYYAGFCFVFWFACSFLDPGYTPRSAFGVALSGRFCSSCKLGQADTTVHCKYCDRCVEGFIQHNLFLGSCIGRKNRVHFYASLALLHGLLLVLISLQFYCLSWISKFWPSIGLIIALSLETFLMMATIGVTCDKQIPSKYLEV